MFSDGVVKFEIGLLVLGLHGQLSLSKYCLKLLNIRNWKT